MDDMPGIRRKRDIGLLVIRQLHQRLDPCSGTYTMPGLLIDVKGVPQCWPRLRGEQIRRNLQVNRRITNTRAREVDDGKVRLSVPL